MRFVLVYFIMDDAGSAQDIRNYVRTAKALGHQVAVYGPADLLSPYNFSRDVEQADGVAFIFEWTTKLRFGSRLDLARIVASVPRKRRIVIDCDGNYNEAITIRGDYNHRDEAAASTWREVCDSLSDKVCQPTLHPLRPNVRPFFFHAYDPEWERPFDFGSKEFGMVYVGHSKFRWGPMRRVLKAIEPLGQRVGRIALVGHGWDSMPSWAGPMQIEDAYVTDVEYMEKFGIEFVQPIPSDQVITWMSKGWFNPVIYRPLFEHLRMVTCRTFETPGAGTIPLFGLGAAYVSEIYGACATELVLPDDRPEEKIADILERPRHYAEAVGEIRRHLAARHSYATRIQQLIEIINE
jgi:hypothetical protein